jgi:hypothetical protein
MDSPDRYSLTPDPLILDKSPTAAGPPLSGSGHSAYAGSEAPPPYSPAAPLDRGWRDRFRDARDYVKSSFSNAVKLFGEANRAFAAWSQTALRKMTGLPPAERNRETQTADSQDPYSLTPNPFGQNRYSLTPNPVNLAKPPMASAKSAPPPYSPSARPEDRAARPPPSMSEVPPTLSPSVTAEDRAANSPEAPPPYSPGAAKPSGSVVIAHAQRATMQTARLVDAPRPQQRPARPVGPRPRPDEGIKTPRSEVKRGPRIG